MIHLAKRVRLVLPKLRSGVGGVICSAHPECESEWGPHYALLKDAVPNPFVAGQRFFDHDEWWRYFKDIVLECFRPRKYRVVFANELTVFKVTDAIPKRKVHSQWIAPGTIVIKRWRISEELEFMRAGETLL